MEVPLGSETLKLSFDILVDRFGETVVHNMGDDGKQDYTRMRVNARELAKMIPYPKLIKAATEIKEHWQMHELVTFAIFEMNNKDTRGVYHALMPVVHAYHRIPVIHGFPRYETLEPSLRKDIIPARVEYYVLYAVHERVLSDPHLSEIRDKLKMDLQVEMDAISQRSFDASYKFGQLNLEINEPGAHTPGSEKERLKECISKCHNYALLRFWDTGNADLAHPDRTRAIRVYADQVVDKLKDAMVAKGFTVDYSWIEFKMKTCEELSTLQTERFGRSIIDSSVLRKAYQVGVQKKEKLLRTIMCSDNQDLRVSSILELRKKSIGAANISIAEAAKLLEVSRQSLSVIALEYGNVQARDNELFLTWEGLCQLLLGSAELTSKVEVDVLWQYILQLGPIYEEMLMRTRRFFQERTTSASEIHHMIGHREEKIQNRYQLWKDAAARREEALREKLQTMQDTDRVIRQNGRRLHGMLAAKVSQYKNQRERKLLASIEQRLDHFEEIFGARQEQDPDPYTIQRVVGKPLIAEFDLDDFPYVYTGDRDDYVATRNILEWARSMQLSEGFIEELQNAIPERVYFGVKFVPPIQGCGSEDEAEPASTIDVAVQTVPTDEPAPTNDQTDTDSEEEDSTDVESEANFEDEI